MTSRGAVVEHRGWRLTLEADGVLGARERGLGRVYVVAREGDHPSVALRAALGMIERFEQAMVDNPAFRESVEKGFAPR